MSWPVVPITKVARVVGGATPKSDNAEFWGGTVEWVTPKDLSGLADKLISSTPRKITEAGLRSCAAELLPAGSVLFSSRAPIGHVAINAVPMATNQGFKSFVPGPELDASFLYWWLDAHRAELQAMGTGATFKEVSKAVVERIEIPLPPLAEQKRIAAILDQAARLTRLRAEALARLDTLGQAIFHEMFGETNTPAVSVRNSLPALSVGWTWERLTNVARLATGHTPDRNVPEYWDGGVSWISLKEIRGLDGREVAETELKISEDGLKHSSAVLLPRDTVCLSRTASVGFVTIMSEEMATSQDFVNWVCGPRLNPRYLMQAFIHARKELRSLATGSTHRTIYFPTAKQFKILVPPKPLQDLYVEKISGIAPMRRRAMAAQAEQQTLFASLQHRAFRGEL